MTASSAAYADYSIIRWTSGFCQIWTNSTPWKPFPRDYKAGRIQFRTFGAASAAKAQLIARRVLLRVSSAPLGRIAGLC